MAMRRRLLDDHHAWGGVGVLLNDDGVGTLRDRSAGEDTYGFAGGNLAVIAASRRGLADQPERRRQHSNILGPDGIAVHG